MNVHVSPLSELGEAALAYAARGFHVFPLAPGQKVALYSKEEGGNGHLDATTNPHLIRWWWGNHPEANIGLNLAASGFVALDPDLYKPDCGWGAFMQGRDLPETLTQRTPRGGFHYIFKANEGEAFAGILCAGVEIKHNGYIVLEPSVFEGKRYVFENDADPVPAPDWVPRKAARQAGATGSAKKPSFTFIDTGGFGEAGIEEVREALAFIDPDLDYHRWIGALMALHHHHGVAGIALAIDWSARGSKYVEGEIERKWPGLQAGRGHTISFVFSLAREAGCDLGALARKHRSGSAGSAAGGSNGGGNPGGDGGQKQGSETPGGPGDKKPGGLQVLSSAEFLGRWQAKSFLLKGIIEEGRLLTLCGPTGTGKTAVALLIALHIALKRMLAGLKVRQAGVLFLAGENPDDVRTRWLAMLRREMIDPATVDVRFVEGRFSIDEQLEAIRAHLAERPAGLVIPDTLQAFFTGDDSNSNDQMKAAAFGFREITKAGPAVLIPSHPIKGATKDRNVPYGGGALLNEVDGNLSLWGSQTSVELHYCGKFRGSFEPLHFALDVGAVPDAVDADGDPIRTVTARSLAADEAESVENVLNADLHRLLRVVHANPGASLDKLAGTFRGPGWSRSNVDRKLKELAADGLIERAAGKVALTPKGRRFVENVE